jgi:DNA primase
MDHKAAMEYLGEDYHQPKAEKAQVIKIKNTQASYKFMHEVAMQYHDFLLQTPGAMRYLEGRGLSEETIKRYKLGYTDGHVLSLNWAWEQELALEAGLVNRAGYETLSHRITIPNLTETGQCDFIVGRTISADKVKYLGLRVPKPIHGFYEVRHSPVIFLVEGQFDWLTLRQWGYPAAVVGGTHISRPNLLLLSGKRIVIIPDYDDSGVGQNAAKRMADQFGEAASILDYSELKTNSGKLDINTLAESPGGELLFNLVIGEQLPWLTTMSKRVLTKWLPALADTAFSLST